MCSKIKRRFNSLQYKQNRREMCKMIKKYDWLRFYLNDMYDISEIENHNLISYED